MFEAVIYLIMFIVYVFVGALIHTGAISVGIYSLYLIIPLMCFVLGFVFGFKRGIKIRFSPIMGFMLVITSIFVNLGKHIFVFMLSYTLAALLGQISGILLKKIIRN